MASMNNMTAMSNYPPKSFPSKILLFGEYSIIKNSMALAMPYPLFDGKLSFRRDGSQSIDPELKALAEYIKKLSIEDKLLIDFDVESFEFDVGQGLFFDSTIPQGFGVGSSGAVIAALHDRYSREEKDQADIGKLKNHFAMLESHFHGSSSGVDPLISYLNSPILIRNKQDLGPVFIPKYKQGEASLFLLNTKRSRKTEPLVNLFLEKCSNEMFAKQCEDILAPVTNYCIDDFLKGNIGGLIQNFKELSRFQYQHFTPMIPTLYRDLWRNNLESGDFYLKLCGAGGGGFLMGLAPNYKKAKIALAGHEVRSIISF